MNFKFIPVMRQYEKHFKGIFRRSCNKNSYLNCILQLKNITFHCYHSLFTSQKPYVIMINDQPVTWAHSRRLTFQAMTFLPGFCLMLYPVLSFFHLSVYSFLLPFFVPICLPSLSSVFIYHKYYQHSNPVTSPLSVLH
jgi:hypothetical protein